MGPTPSTSSWIDAGLELPKVQVGHYEKEGYVLPGRVLSEEGVAGVRGELDRIIQNLHPSVTADQINAVHQKESWLLDLVGHPTLLDVIEKITGPNIVLWQTFFICKPPKTGREIPWHQDLNYWNIEGTLASIWIALDDMSDENGTMYVLPGYHNKGALAHESISDDFFTDAIKQDALPGDVEERQAGYFFNAGEGAIHHERIPHRSPPNTSNRWRRVMIARYISADGKLPPRSYRDYETGEEVERQCTLLRGEDVAGQGLVRL